MLILPATIPVMFLLNKVIACPECDEVGVVGGGGDRHTAGAANVRVAQLVGQHLQLVRAEVVVIPQHVVVGWSTRTLSTTPGV